MPKEAKKRGRRAERKRKEEAEKGQPGPQVVALAEEAGHFHSGYDGVEAWGEEEDTQFYGLLNGEESEYFRKADEILELNQFGDGDERALFIANVWKEANGKELKIANSQGCSRLLERLILMSSPSQLKSLWRKFTGHFLNLAQHRFASHCCEMLFRQSVGIASKEMEDDYVDDTVTDEFFASMESLFLYMLSELEPQLKHLCTDRFASHTVRGLLLLLSGQTVPSDVVQSRKKEKITLSSDFAPISEPAENIPVPQSFHDAIGKILAATAGGMSTEEIRSMAVHQIGGPTLQVLMQLEMGRSSNDKKAGAASKENTLLGKLTGISAEDEKSGESDSSSFFNNLLYDPVGSHLAEKIVVYAPKKDFKKLYKAFFKGRIGSLARNETAGFVVQRILGRLEKHMLEEALGEILPQVKGLIERSQVAVVKTLIDRCAKQGVEASGIAEAIASAYGCEPAELIFNMMGLTPEDLTPKEETSGKAKRDPSQRYGSLLAQSMLQLPGKFHGIISESILAQPPQTIAGLSQLPQASHLIQAYLQSPHTTTPNKRTLLNILKGSFVTLSLSPNGSHIVDACWPATQGIMYIKQAIASELLSGEASMRESFFGRVVWRNWSMDKYKRSRNQWFAIANGGPMDGDRNNNSNKVEKKKTAIELTIDATSRQLARERHASRKNSATGPNKRRQEQGSVGIKKIRR
ncbi:unnamed protein product [Tuber aestivum]|uniref:Nucleolar protein 9 n=1 Tax=Tuber aestivum TaxID=59557 RepID=A0A292PQ71_9PEZI|nr:unnamed protein product [Tuber aestivum]